MNANDGMLRDGALKDRVIVITGGGTGLGKSMAHYCASLGARVSQNRPDAAIGAGLVLGILLWGGNNVALKRVVADWPPLFTGATRFLVAGLLLLGLLRGTRWLGEWKAPDAALRRDLWWRAGFSLAV